MFCNFIFFFFINTALMIYLYQCRPRNTVSYKSYKKVVKRNISLKKRLNDREFQIELLLECINESK